MTPAHDACDSPYAVSNIVKRRNSVSFQACCFVWLFLSIYSVCLATGEAGDAARSCLSAALDSRTIRSGIRVASSTRSATLPMSNVVILLAHVMPGRSIQYSH